jgi:Tfp pilus assembly protein PilE
MDYQEQPKNKRYRDNTPKKESQNIPVSVDITNKKYWGNGISIIAVIVSAILAFFTWKLYKKAVDDSAITKQAADASTVAAYQSIKAYKLAETAADNANSFNLKNYKIQKDAIKAQINSLKETQHEFEASNEPFLQAGTPTISQLDVGKSLIGEIAIYNLSNVPVKIISQKSAITIRVSPFAITKVPWSNEEEGVNAYVIKESPMTVKFTTKKYISNGQYAGLRSGDLSIFEVREIKYKNLMTNKTRYYIVELQMKPIWGNTSMPNNIYSVFHINENQYSSVIK